MDCSCRYMTAAASSLFTTLYSPRHRTCCSNSLEKLGCVSILPWAECGSSLRSWDHRLDVCRISCILKFLNGKQITFPFDKDGVGSHSMVSHVCITWRENIALTSMMKPFPLLFGQLYLCRSNRKKEWNFEILPFLLIGNIDWLIDWPHFSPAGWQVITRTSLLSRHHAVESSLRFWFVFSPMD